MATDKPISGVLVETSSRYKETPLYQLGSGAYEWSLWVSNPSIRDDPNYDVVQIADSDIGRLDRVSYNIYGTPEYWWMIADANNYIDPIRDMKIGDFMKIPRRSILDNYAQRSQNA